MAAFKNEAIQLCHCAPDVFGVEGTPIVARAPISISIFVA